MHLHWFRSDLRLLDNTALFAASEAAKSAGQPLAALYVISPGDWLRHDTAAVRVDLILRTLALLSRDLATLNIPLIIRTAPTPSAVAPTVVDVARTLKATHVFCNIEYELNEKARDTALKAALATAGIALHESHDQCILEPGCVLTLNATPYTVFTPFKRAWFKVFADRTPDLRSARTLPAPHRQARTQFTSDPVPLSVAGHISQISPDLWPAGEAHALNRLDRFIAAHLHGYKARRDSPAADATSTISPYLAAGIISPRQCLHAAQTANGGFLDGGSPGPACWISELIWREFYRHILVAFPRVCMHRAFKPATERIQWNFDQRQFDAWCTGRTGYPIVDAAMRQLLHTGFMHNRLRMITAMFFTKDLFFDWRRGEKHFMRHLVDGDLASNNGGWQWSASTGTDAAPYFRIFNPITQSKTCDPDGAFIRRFVPELASLDSAAIHDPDTLPPLARAALDYPRKIVDRAIVRDRVLAAFKAIGAA